MYIILYVLYVTAAHMDCHKLHIILYMQISQVAQKQHILAYEKYAKKLMECLPMDDTVFITKLSNHDLLSEDTSDQVKALPTPVAKASYLLDHVIKPTLDIGANFIFDNLLSIMEHCGYAHVEKLAHKINSEIHTENDNKPGMISSQIQCTCIYCSYIANLKGCI